MKGKRTGWVIGTTAVMAGVSLLMILSPALAGAVHSQGIVTVSPPFKGSVSPSESWSISGCGKAKIITKSTFSLATGAGGWSGSGAGRTCKGASTASGDASGGFTAYLNVPFHKGSTTVYINGTYASSGSILFTAGTCTILGSPSYAYCDRYAESYIDGYVYFYDLTTGTSYYLGGIFHYNETYNDTYWSGSSSTSSGGGTSGPVSQSGTYSFSYTLPVNMVKSNHYQVQFNMYMAAYGECYAYNYNLVGCSASATMNGATLGNGVTVSSIVLA